MKRTLLFMLVLLPMLTSADVVEIDGIFYNLVTKEMEAEVTSNPNRYEGDVVIPESVTYKDTVYNVTTIGEYAFMNCGGLTSITIRGSVSTIGREAFSGCSGLTSIVIPESVTFIGIGAFCGCFGLTSITIPNSLTRIGNYVFSQCVGLTSITIPNSVTSIGEGSFFCCSGLTSVSIPNSVTTIDVCAFYECLGLTSITIPNSVTYIDRYAFAWCKGLTSVKIGSGIENIEENAFELCSGLTDMCCYAEIVPKTNGEVFKDTYIENVTLHVPAASVSAYQVAEPWKNFKEIVALTDEGSDGDDSDYLPFVKEGKRWNVFRSDFETGSHLEQYMLMNEEIVKDGKTYMKMYRSEEDSDVVYDTGLFREEDHKVYRFDTERQEEHLLFDYSLKEGDTYETYSYDEQRMVSYKVLSVSDYQEGPEVIRYDYDQAADSMITHRRYLKKWTVCRTDDEPLQKTWIEGVGSLEGPLGNLHDVVLPGMSKDYLAFVEYLDGDPYLPFSFYDTLNGQMHGCNLPTGEKNNEEGDGRHKLTYELKGDRLHIYGEVFTQCGPNNYAYFIEKPTDDPLVHKIEFEIQEVEPTMDCTALHTTDFYVPGFDPILNYIVVDNQGEEHPVINKTAQMAYRPMVEEGKVWKVGALNSGNPVQWVECFYFNGDAIIAGRTCKQMMCQRFISPDLPEYDFYSQQPSLSYVGAWYEEGKKVYEYDTTSKQFKLMYDFSIEAYDTLEIDNQLYVIGLRQTGGMKGFKGVYREVWDGENTFRCAPWLEGVGGVYGPPTTNVLNVDLADPAWFLMLCTVGDEVIYFLDGIEDGTTPEEARKRFDFTHTIKTKPQAPRRAMGTRSSSSTEAEPILYGEYNNLHLGINLDPLADAYQVSITDETGKAVYEKTVNAGSIVGLNIDISTYAAGRYTVVVENSQEVFTGEFETLTTGICLTPALSQGEGTIYNLQGQRISTLQKGLNIVNGQKVYVK